MTVLRLAVLVLSAACSGGDAPAPSEPTPAPVGAATPDGQVALETDDDKTFYALGLSVGESLKPFALTAPEAERVLAGLEDALAGRPQRAELKVYGPKIRDLARARGELAAKAAREKAVTFLADLAATPGAVKTESGIVYIEATKGTGPSPKPSDTVSVHYRGTLPDGTEFDSSYARNEPAEFPLDGVIPCWTEGVGKMQVGGKAKLGCPSELAYGERGSSGIPGGSALLFEVELLAIR